MKRGSKIILSCVLGWLGMTSPAAAATFEVGFYDYPPMMIEHDNSGIYKDIFDELSLLLGDVFNVRYYPYPRIGLLFNSGELDIEPGVYAGWMRGQPVPGEFSVPFGKIVDVMVFAPGKAFPVNKPEDLRGKALGLVRGYAYPDLRALIDAGQIDRRNGLSEMQLLEMLSVSRFDQIVINKAVAQYNILKVPEYQKFEVGNSISVFDVSMRVHPRNKAWLSRLDKAILELKRNGVIERIYAKYGVHL
ncbi:substrate-binding periplasmic protein [Pseudomonas borbori]